MKQFYVIVKNKIIFLETKWNETGLKWCIDDYDLTPDMTKAEQKNAIRQAFQVTKAKDDRIVNLYIWYLSKY